MTLRVTVIGAGVGGLAGALRLCAAGAEVTVLERRDRPGGWLGRTSDGPFAWDVGPASIAEPRPFRRLFEAAGRELPQATALEQAPMLRPLEPRRPWTSELPGARARWPSFCRTLDGGSVRSGPAWAPQGGPASIASSIAAAIEDLGGRIVYGDGADEILVYGGRQRVVRTLSGAELLGDAVVANGDPIQTRRRLLRSTPAPLRSRLGRHRPGPSCLLLRLGLDRRYAAIGSLTPISGPEPLWLQASIRPDAAPEGCSALTVVLPLPAGTPADETTTATVRDRLLAFLEREAGLDGLEGAIVAEHRLGPAAIADAFDCYLGGTFDSRPAGERSGQPARDASVDGLFHVGAHVRGGGGLAGALASAERVAGLVARLA